MSTSAGPRPASGHGIPGSSRAGRRFAQRSSRWRIARIEPHSETWSGTDGSPIAPIRTASCAAERSARPSASSARARGSTPSPTGSSVHSTARPSASTTFRASAITSGPTPSPASTATRWVKRPRPRAPARSRRRRARPRARRRPRTWPGCRTGSRRAAPAPGRRRTPAGTIVGQPYWSRSTAVARMQPLVVAPQRITESTPCETRIEARFVPKKPDAPFFMIDRLVVARVESRVDLDPAAAELQGRASAGTFCSQRPPSLRLGSKPIVVKTTGSPFSRAASRRRFVASTSARQVRAERARRVGEAAREVDHEHGRARAPSVTACPRPRACVDLSAHASSLTPIAALRRRELFAEARALHELPVARLRDELVALDDHLAADEHDLGCARSPSVPSNRL